MSDVVYDNKGQFEQVQSGLLEGEQIIAVYDAIGVGTGFIGLTNRRIVVQDKSFVGKRIALTSIPYSRVSSVSVVSNKSWAGQFFSSGTIGGTGRSRRLATASDPRRIAGRLVARPATSPPTTRVHRTSGRSKCRSPSAP